LKVKRAGYPALQISDKGPKNVVFESLG